MYEKNMYEKENTNTGYQIKTRQYSNMNLREQTVNYNKGYEVKAQKHYDLGSSSKYRRPNISEGFNRFENSQSSEKYELYNLSSQENARRRPYLNNYIVRESEEASMNIQNKRQGSRKQELQMRMNNINSINDKIYNLLNLVKKERLHESKQKEDQFQPRIINPSSPVAINRNRKMASNYKPQQEVQQKKEGENGEDVTYLKRNNKSLKRLRTLSILQPNLINRGKEKLSYSPMQFNNQEDVRYERRENNNKSYYSPVKVERFEAYEQRTFQSIGSNNNGNRYNNYSPINSQKKRNNGLITNNTGDRMAIASNYEMADAPYDGQNNLQKVQSNPSRRSDYSSNYMPITLIQNEKQIEASSEQKCPQSYSGLKIIQKQLKRIKQKMGEQSYPCNNRQKIDLTSTRKQIATNSSAKAGHNSSGKQFELKIYPVNNDRPQTIKIAEKLCFQIQIDSRMKKAKEDFLRIEGEQKWRNLNEKLSKYEMRLTLNELKAFITSSNINNSKFHTEQATDKKVQALAQQFADGQKFWEKHVIGCANLKVLRRQGFDARSLDKNNNGYLSIEDISSFVNEYTAHSYTSSDLANVFRRLQLHGGNSSEGVEYSTFMQAFTM